MSDNTKESPEEIVAREKFNSLLDTKRTLPTEYANLIARQERRDDRERFQKEPYSNGWWALLGNRPKAEAACEFFRKKIRDMPLLNPGGGFNSMQDFASEFDSSQYIHIDRDYDNTPPNPLKIHRLGSLINENVGREVYVHADMLDFVSRLRDQVASFTLNGIDNYIVDDPNYHAALAKEMIRATPKNGLIFGISSWALEKVEQLGRRSSSIRAVDLEKETGFRLFIPGWYIFEKME